MNQLAQKTSNLSLEERKEPTTNKKQCSKEEKDSLKTSKPKGKGEVLAITGFDEILGLLSWNYKHETKKIGKNGTDNTKAALIKLLDDVSIDIFSMQELLWGETMEVHIPRPNDKFSADPINFEIIKTAKESGFYYNSSELACEKIDHVLNPTIEKETFDYAFNTRTCIGKFTYLSTKYGPLVFYGVSYHGPKNKLKDSSRQEFTRQFFQRIREMQESTYRAPFFITGDFNTNIEKLETEGLRVFQPNDPEDEIKKPIDFVCIFNTEHSPWRISISECSYEHIEKYEGASTHPPIFSYLVFKHRTD